MTLFYFIFVTLIRILLSIISFGIIKVLLLFLGCLKSIFYTVTVMAGFVMGGQNYMNNLTKINCPTQTKIGIIGITWNETTAVTTTLIKIFESIQRSSSSKDYYEWKAYIDNNIFKRKYPSILSKTKKEIEENFEQFFHDLRHKDINILIIAVSGDRLCLEDYYAIRQSVKTDIPFFIIISDPSNSHSQKCNVLKALKKLDLKSKSYEIQKMDDMLKMFLNESLEAKGYIKLFLEFILRLSRQMVGIRTSKSVLIKNVEHEIQLAELDEIIKAEKEKLFVLENETHNSEDDDNLRLKEIDEEAKRILEFEKEREQIVIENERRWQLEKQQLMEERMKKVNEATDRNTNLSQISEEITTCKQDILNDQKKQLEKILALVSSFNADVTSLSNTDAIATSHSRIIKTIDTEEIVISSKNKPKIGIIGLSKSGRSTLMGVLAGGIWTKNITENPTSTENYDIYKLSYPNNGLIEGSADENKQMYQEFYDSKQLKNLSVVLLTVYGSFRDNDYYMIMTAQKHKLPIAIIITKLDELVENTHLSKQEYVDQDKEYFYSSLNDGGIRDMEDKIFHISALSNIWVVEDGLENEMARYQQDEELLQQFLNLHGISWRNPFESFGKETLYLETLPKTLNTDANKNVGLEFSSTNIKNAEFDAINCVEQNFMQTTQEHELCIRSHRVAVLGRNKVGKKWLKEGLEKLLSEKKTFVLYGYDEWMSTNDIIQKFNETPAKLYIIVIPYTVGSADIKIIRHLNQMKKSVIIVLNKSDEIIDNLKKSGKYTDNQSCVEQRKKDAEKQLEELNIFGITMFSVSALFLKALIDDSYKTEENDLINFIKENVDL